MMLMLHQQNKITWVHFVMVTLYRHGFGYVWESPDSVGHRKLFLKMFKDRLVECSYQDWHFKINNSERFQTYSSFKVDNNCGSYLHDIRHTGMRDTLIKFRLGVSDLRCHRLRYNSSTDTCLHCPFCNELETELHFLFICPRYEDLRALYIPKKFYRYPSQFRFSVLMSDSCPKLTRDLACFIYKAMKRREAGN